MQRQELPLSPAEIDAALAADAAARYDDPWTEVERLVDQGVANYDTARLMVGIPDEPAQQAEGPNWAAIEAGLQPAPVVTGWSGRGLHGTARRPYSGQGPQRGEEVGVGLVANATGDYVSGRLDPEQAARNAGAIAVLRATLPQPTSRR